MIPNCSNCKYSTIIGLDLVCDGEKEPYKVSPTHYCEDWLYWLQVPSAQAMLCINIIIII